MDSPSREIRSSECSKPARKTRRERLEALSSGFCALSFRQSAASRRPWNYFVWFNQINKTDEIDQSPQIQVTTKQMMLAIIGIENSEMV
jgi:hypothetical protein